MYSKTVWVWLSNVPNDCNSFEYHAGRRKDCRETFADICGIHGIFAFEGLLTASERRLSMYGLHNKCVFFSHACDFHSPFSTPNCSYFSSLPTRVLPRTFSAQFTGTIIALGGSATWRAHVFITSIACNDTIACGTNFHLTRSAETDSLVSNHACVANGNVASAANVLYHDGNIIFDRT